MFFEYLKLIIGFVLLIAGSEVLIRGGIGVANKLKIPAMLVGVTIIAFGTSLPELIVSLNAGLKGNAGISVGNAVGSNICNILLIIGLSTLIKPITVNHKFFNADNLFLFIATILFVVLAFIFESLPKPAGYLMFLTFIAFMYFSITNALRAQRKKPKEIPDDELELLKKGQPLIVSLFFIVTGLAVLVYGADTLVNSAVIIAKSYGVSEAIIGLTLIAIGTSLPELATYVMAAIKKQNEMALGNIIGSNIFNLLFILGLTASIIPLQIDPQMLKVDNIVMLFATLIFMLCLYLKKLPRWLGLMLVLIYFGYLYYLYLNI
jgi:cation:H+ antiporter